MENMLSTIILCLPVLSVKYARSTRNARLLFLAKAEASHIQKQVKHNEFGETQQILHIYLFIFTEVCLHVIAATYLIVLLLKAAFQMTN